MFYPSQQPPLRIAILRTSSIGDVVLSTACLDLLKELPLPIAVTFITKEPCLKLLASSYKDVAFVDLAKFKSSAELVNQLKNVHFLLDLQTNFRSAMICHLFTKTFGKPAYGCSKRKWYRTKLVFTARFRDRQKSTPYLTKQVPIPYQYEMMVESLKKALKQHLPQEQLDNLKKIIPRPQLPLLEDPLTNAASVWEKELKIGTWLAVACGASFQAKQAPLPKVASIILELQKRSAKPFGLVMLGDHNDKKPTAELLQLLSWSQPVLDLTGQIPLDGCKKALRHVKALLSNDSGLAHIAEAVGTPVCALFGPTVEAFGFQPWMGDSRAFSVPIGCRPCSKHGQTPCRFKDYACFNQIPQEQVADHLLHLLFDEKG